MPKYVVMTATGPDVSWLGFFEDFDDACDAADDWIEGKDDESHAWAVEIAHYAAR